MKKAIGVEKPGFSKNPVFFIVQQDIFAGIRFPDISNYRSSADVWMSIGRHHRIDDSRSALIADGFSSKLLA